MPYYPIFLDLQGQKIIVVGGGSVAERKIEMLLEFGGTVSVIARSLTPAVKRYVSEGSVIFLEEEFSEGHLEGALLVIAATDDPALNHRVSACARERGILVNVVDKPPDCSFIVPSIVKRGDLVIAISTSGKSPALAKKVREGIEKDFGPEYESFLVLMGNLRGLILSQGLPHDQNRNIFRELVDSRLLDTIREKDWSGAASILNRVLNTRFSSSEVMNYLQVC